MLDFSSICPFWSDAEFQEAWQEWFYGAKRKTMKCSSSDRAIRMALRHIMASYKTKEKAIEGIDYSSYKGYTDVGYKVPEDFSLGIPMSYGEVPPVRPKKIPMPELKI
jgi:hypothetical protein